MVGDPMFDDLQIPLAHAGRALVLGSFHFELTDEHPAAYLDLVRDQYLACLFQPLWGVIFDNGDQHAADPSN